MSDIAAQGANFYKARMSGTVLKSAELQHANFSRVEAHSASFQDAELTGANLSYGTFSHASFRAADLTNAQLTGAVFDGADFRDTDLTRHLAAWRRPGERARPDPGPAGRSLRRCAHQTAERPRGAELRQRANDREAGLHPHDADVPAMPALPAAPPAPPAPRYLLTIHP